MKKRTIVIAVWVLLIVLAIEFGFFMVRHQYPEAMVSFLMGILLIFMKRWIIDSLRDVQGKKTFDRWFGTCAICKNRFFKTQRTNILCSNPPCAKAYRNLHDL